jgi:hypothetical protein
MIWILETADIGTQNETSDPDRHRNHADPQRCNIHSLDYKIAENEKESAMLYTNAKKLEFLCFLSSPFSNHCL